MPANVEVICSQLLQSSPDRDKRETLFVEGQMADDMAKTNTDNISEQNASTKIAEVSMFYSSNQDSHKITV